MVGGLFSDRDPWEVVPARYRPPAAAAAPAPREMTAEERAAAEEAGLIHLGAALRRLT